MKLKKQILLLFVLSSGQLLNLSAGDEVKPNVLVIYTDDHRYTGVHALGGQAVRTPHMDSLCNNGVNFTHTYLQGAFSGATCMPSRAMLITGRNLWELDGNGRNIPEAHTMMGEAFRNAGYNTYHVGKWHQDHQSLSRSADDGAVGMGLGVYFVDHFRMPLWDWDKNGDFSKDKAYILKYDDEGTVVRRKVSNQDKRGPVSTEETGPHTSEIFADNAIDFISNYESGNEDKPFFMYLAFHAPHDPPQAPQAYRELYPVNEIQLPPSYMQQHPFDNGHMVLRDEELAPWPRTPAIAKQELADYYAIITHLDAQIGRVVHALKESGQYENTIIVLSGDSGLAVGNHGLLGKQSVYDEDGIHVPFIVSGKIKGQGERYDGFAYIHDIFPTICELADIETPESVTGISQVPQMKGQGPLRTFTYHAYRQHQRAYRKGDYKLIEYVRAPDWDWRKKVDIVAGSRVTQLFNVTNDPWETQDLSFFPEYREVVAEMRKEMVEQAKLHADNIQSTGEKYDFWEYFN